MPNSYKAKTLSSNKVFQVLALLSEEEKKCLIKFVDSPYFNQSRLLKKLLAALLGALDKNGDEGFIKEKIWKKVYGNEDYNDVNFRKGCSDLLKLLESFLVTEDVQKSKGNYYTVLFETVTKKSIEPLYNSAYNKATKANQQGELFHTSEQLSNNVKIETNYFNMKNYTFKPTEKWNTTKISKYLDEFYWTEKLRIAFANLAQTKYKNFDYDIWFQNNIEAAFNGFDFEKSPQIATYYYMYLSSKDYENTEHFYSIKKILLEFGNTLPKGEANNVFDSALNYCIGHINKGVTLFFEEFIELTELGLKNGLMFSNGEITPLRFSNAVSIAMRIGKTDWALNFIEKYKQNLPEYTQENTYAYSLARIYFHQKQFDELLRLLLSVDFEDINYSLIGKAMTATAYYEIKEYDALDSFLDSFKVYLNRQKNIPTERKKSYQNFIRYIRKLTRLIPGDKAQVVKLREEIAANRKTTRNYEWLMEKLDEQ